MRMTRAQAKRLVILAAVVAAAVSTVRSLRQRETPDPSIYLGAFIAALVLSLLAEAAPEIAGGLATVLILSTLLSGGEDLARVSALVTRNARSRTHTDLL